MNIKTVISFILFHIKRTLNQRHCYDYPATLRGWEKVGKVLGNVETGSLFDPCVIINDNKDFIMIYSNRRNNSLERVISNDGKNWNQKANVLKGIPGTWETVVNRGCLLYHKGIWLLWYTGQNRGQSSIGYAVSLDNIHFNRVQSQPVITVTLPMEGVSVMNPCVVWSETKQLFQMWYAAGENYEPDVICYAESIDGINWVKKNEPVLKADKRHVWEQYKVGGCSVNLKDNGLYVMYYIGYQNLDVARICYATSYDGISWKRDDNNLLVSPSKDDWDINACYKPTVVQAHNKLIMWYNGLNKTDEYICLTTKSI